jgi:hypothetical protein
LPVLGTAISLAWFDRDFLRFAISHLFTAILLRGPFFVFFPVRFGAQAHETFFLPTDSRFVDETSLFMPCPTRACGDASFCPSLS